MSEKELREVAAEIARHLRWTQSLGEKTLPAPRAEALAARPAEEAAARSLPDQLPSPQRGEGAEGRGRPQPPPERPNPVQAPPAAAVSLPDQLPSPQRGEGAGERGRPQLPPERLFALGLASPELRAIRDELGDCRRCKLCQGRRNLVFGTGNPKARLVFVGEGPGAEEDAQGIPFVGAAGQLLTRMIEAMGLRRDEVYICNVVKCRPPGNRTPEGDEVEACEPFLQAQLRAIGPEVIVALGKSAAQSLLRESTPITRLRGQWRRYQGIELMPTFHPAYLLRSPHEKAKAWADLQQVMRRLGLPLRR